MQNLGSEIQNTRNNPSRNKNANNGEFAETYTELGDIQKDWTALKNDVAKLSRHASNDGRKRLSEIKQKSFDRLERQVHDKPAQTLAIAFFAGAIASLFLGRRGRR